MLNKKTIIKTVLMLLLVGGWTDSIVHGRDGNWVTSYRNESIIIYQIFDWENLKECTINYRLPGDWKRYAREYIKEFNGLSPSSDELNQYAKGYGTNNYLYSYTIPLKEYTPIPELATYHSYLITPETVSEVSLRIKAESRYKETEFQYGQGVLKFDCNAPGGGFVVLSKNKLPTVYSPFSDEMLKSFDEEFFPNCEKEHMTGGLVFSVDSDDRIGFLIFDVYFKWPVPKECKLKFNNKHLFLLKFNKNNFEQIAHAMVWHGD